MSPLDRSLSTLSRPGRPAVGPEVAREALDGIRPDATLVTDRYADYNRLLCHRQFCYEHLKRDALDIARQFPHNAECQCFPARATPPAPLPRNTISQFIAPSSSLLSENLPSSGLAGKGRGSPRTIPGVSKKCEVRAIALGARAARPRCYLGIPRGKPFSRHPLDFRGRDARAPRRLPRPRKAK